MCIWEASLETERDILYHIAAVSEGAKKHPGSSLGLVNKVNARGSSPKVRAENDRVGAARAQNDSIRAAPDTEIIRNVL
jgi:hypothetical protein